MKRLNKSKITLLQLIEAAKRYYAMSGNDGGGNFHIVLDDGNLDDRDVLFCIDRAEEDGDENGLLLGKMLLKISLEQREELYNNYSAYCCSVNHSM